MAVRSCSSTTFTLSVEMLNCACGAEKLRRLRLPLALVWPIEAARPSTNIEFCVNLTLALRTFSDCLSVGVFRDAFITRPLPLKVIAEAFFSGPTACKSRLSVPVPLIPSSAVTP